jgi:nucleotide-binding universal stress UspA family protein
MKIQKVLLTTDLSDEAERPYAAIAQLARQLGAHVTLLHVVEDITMVPHGAPLAPPMHSPDLTQQIGQARQLLAEHAGKLGEGIQVESDVISATEVGDAIAKYAFDHGFNLLALSTHGRTGFRRMVMGSVAEVVLRHAKIPVLVFPRSE